MLWNIGFVEALKLEQFDCIFLHDVDHLPEDDRYDEPDDGDDQGDD